MAFDAGAITARVDIDLADANRKLDTFERRIKAATKDQQIRISAVMADADLNKARRMFAQLDQNLSRDAMQRLKSSPQGSVLGSLNALFSPHTVSGAPTAAQSAQQGLLGKMAQTMSGPGGGQSGSSTNQGAAGMWGKIFGSTLSGGSGRGGGSAAALLGSGVPGGTHGGFFGNLLGGVGPGILGLSGKLAGGIGIGGSLLGALPGILGMAAPFAGIGAGAGVLALGAKTLIGNQQKPGQLYGAAQGAGSALTQGLQTAAGAMAAPLGAVLKQIPQMMASITPALKQVFGAAATMIGPLVSGLVDLAHMVLPDLADMIRATTPMVKPLIDGLGKLVAGILPGLTAIIKAAAPSVAIFAQILGTLGKQVGELFSTMAPAVSQGALIFQALMKVIGGLLPIIGKLAAMFAQALAPAFVSLTSIIQSLEPVLLPLAKILGELAQAVLSDLVSALGAVATVVKDLAPSFKIFAQVMGNVFNVLENSGVFAVLGDALENIAPLVAQLINALVTGLAPIINLVIGVVAKLANNGISLLTTGLEILLPVIIQLVKEVLPILDKVLASILPLIVQVAQQLGPIFKHDLVELMPSLQQLIQATLQIVVALLPVLPPLTKLILLVVELGLKTSTTLIPVLATLIHWIADIVTWLADVVGALVQFGVHWRQKWDDIKQIGKDFWQWLWNDFGAKIANFFTQTIPGWVTSFKNSVESIIGGLKNDLRGLGRDAFNALLDGFKDIAGTIEGWLKDFGGGVMKVLKDVFGVQSPSKAMFQLGVHLMEGLANGLKSSVGLVHGAVGTVGGNVTDWIRQALSMAGMPLSWLAPMQLLVSKESGGNPNAVNPQTAGLSGEHAEGIAQTIPSTFAQYGLGGSIFNPVSDLVASLRYIKAVYGSPFAIPGIGQPGPYMGYDSGGWLSGIPLNRTGQPEAVLTPSQSKAFVGIASGAGSQLALLQAICDRLDSLIGVTGQSGAVTGQVLGRTLNGVARQSSYAALYRR